jgi:sugar lactone lactonase YvrE
MRFKVITGVLAASALLLAGFAQPAQAKKDPIFADGGVLTGSTNGISFAPDGTLYVANVFGSTITQIDPESGEVLSRLTAADSVFFPDDVFVADDGTIYWTEIALGNVLKKPVGETAFPLLGPLFGPPGLNSANPLVLTDEATPRLFAAGCYGGPPGNSFVEIDPEIGGIVNTLFGPVADCASNGLSWYDGFLYSPQPFLDLVWKIDPDNGDRTPVTTNWPVPIGTAFGSDGQLYALAQGVGEVVKIDIDDPDTDNNRTVIAEIPVAWADNIAVLTADGEDDRVFISSSTDSTIAEVLPNGDLRIVVPGQFQMSLGASVIGDTVYSTHPSGIVSYDRKSGELIDHYRAPFGVGGFPFALSSVAWGDNLVLMSAFNGDIVLWDPVANEAIERSLLPGPIDAEPFEGDLLVTTATDAEGNGGAIFRVDAELNVLGVVATVPNSTGLTAKGGDVWVADQSNGTILQIIDDGVTLDEPVVAFDGLAGPEGLDISHNRLYVVEGASETLTSIHLRSGKRKTVATDLGFQGPFLFPFGYLNNVTVSANNQIFVNADRRNVVYEF